MAKTSADWHAGLAAAKIADIDVERDDRVKALMTEAERTALAEINAVVASAEGVAKAAEEMCAAAHETKRALIRAVYDRQPKG